ncbi:aspartate/glutamate racemase family protein [Maridesulfovibrio bastinii]|uniref:aspartate/glutamate racemase family protein n=1 Tax=Maridesulfovibrio bastinii TaxID=47157 RepID=UPI00041F7E73|nr:aspartate/glutamate racemase family protein [Maridesulfovibrio bastinii]
MKILVINPNSSFPMTCSIEETAKRVCSKGTIIEACGPTQSPASIEGYYDGAMATYHMLDVVTHKETADGYVVACFDDTGVDALREVVAGPVLGIGEAAMHAASMLACRFSILTTLERSVPIIEDNAAEYGLGRRCRGVHAADIPVLALEDEQDESIFSIVNKAALDILAKDRSDALVLGCGGMTHLAARLEASLGVPVIDGVSAAVGFVEALIRMGLKTSKSGGYAFPRDKQTSQNGEGGNV